MQSPLYAEVRGLALQLLGGSMTLSEFRDRHLDLLWSDDHRSVDDDSLLWSIEGQFAEYTGALISQEDLLSALAILLGIAPSWQEDPQIEMGTANLTAILAMGDTPVSPLRAGTITPRITAAAQVTAAPVAAG
jgi:hypothetical protein